MEKQCKRFQKNKEIIRELADEIIDNQNKKKLIEDLRNDPEFQKKNELGLKRMALVCCVIASLLAIPLFFFIGASQFYLYIFSYFVLVIVGVRLSPKIVNKIWK